MIAAIALSRSMTLVTRSEKYSVVTDLDVLPY